MDLVIFYSFLTDLLSSQLEKHILLMITVWLFITAQRPCLFEKNLQAARLNTAESQRDPATETDTAATSRVQGT